MHTLILVRHGKSDWSGHHADVDRPLAARGRRQVPESGRWLAEHGPAVDLAVVSPAERAGSTWALVAAELDAPPPVRVDDRVYSWSAGDLLDVVTDLPEEASVVAMVGHNPGLEDLAHRLTGVATRLPTSAMALIAVPPPWRDAARSGARLLAAGRPPEPLDDPDSGTP